MDTVNIISISLSTLATIIAIVAPIVTAIVNNKHQRNLMKINLLYKKRYDVYKTFYDEYSKYLISENLNIETILPLITDCLLVASEDTAKSLNSLLRKFKGEAGNNSPTEEQLIKICVTKMKKDLNIVDI